MCEIFSKTFGEDFCIFVHMYYTYRMLQNKEPPQYLVELSLECSNNNWRFVLNLTFFEIALFFGIQCAFSDIVICFLAYFKVGLIRDRHFFCSLQNARDTSGPDHVKRECGNNTSLHASNKAKKNCDILTEAHCSIWLKNIFLHPQIQRNFVWVLTFRCWRQEEPQGGKKKNELHLLQTLHLETQILFLFFFSF